MGARSKARKRALDILFEADQRGLDPLTLMADQIKRGTQGSPLAELEYSGQLVRGVVERSERIDELLTTYSHGWTIERMPAVDRAVLRLGTWELLFNDDVPDAVAIDEAVELARSLSTDDSPGFVNGLLGRLLEVKAL
jgi:N utilization substance protein B